MKSTRKIIATLIAAAGIAGATVIAHAAPPPGYGPGSAGCAFGGPGSGMMGYGGWGGGPMGPGRMGSGGPHGGGYGPGMMGGWGPRGGFGPGTAGRPVAHQEAHLTFLKNELKITSAQEPAWEAFATQAKAQAAAMEAMHAQAPATAPSAAERIEQRAEFARLRAEQAKAMSAAVKDLYTALTPEQKTVADRHFGGMHLAQRGPGRWR